MDFLPYKLVVFDAASHSVLIADGPCGEILAEVPLPENYSLVDFNTRPNSRNICILVAGENNTGALLSLDPDTASLQPLLTAIPTPSHIAFCPDCRIIYFTDASGSFYCYNPDSIALRRLEKPPRSGCCVGLASVGSIVCGVWEMPEGGILAIFNHSGDLLSSHYVGGCPTSLTLDPQSRLFVPFTEGTLGVEGVLIFSLTDKKETVISLQTSCCKNLSRAYPTHVAVDPCRQLAYVACEESAIIGVIDLKSVSLCGSIHLGRSISRLSLLPGNKFALASSNMFADLCLVDLINRRLLSYTANDRELLSPLLVIELTSPGK